MELLRGRRRDISAVNSGWERMERQWMNSKGTKARLYLSSFTRLDRQSVIEVGCYVQSCTISHQPREVCRTKVNFWEAHFSTSIIMETARTSFLSIILISLKVLLLFFHLLFSLYSWQCLVSLVSQWLPFWPPPSMDLFTEN